MVSYSSSDLPNGPSRGYWRYATHNTSVDAMLSVSPFRKLRAVITQSPERRFITTILIDSLIMRGVQQERSLEGKRTSVVILGLHQAAASLAQSAIPYTSLNFEIYQFKAKPSSYIYTSTHLCRQTFRAYRCTTSRK